MKADIKAIAIDMDGTWLRSDCSISEETKEAVQRAADAGYLVIPTTGRSFRNASTVLKDYRGLRYYINANGTTFTDGKEGKLLFSRSMPYAMAKEIYDLTNQYSCFVEIYEGMDAYVDPFGREFLYSTGLGRDYCDQLLSTNCTLKSLDDFMEEEGRQVCKYHIVCANSDQKNQLKRRIAQVEGAYPISTFSQNIEVVYGHHSKADGLRAACEHLGLRQEEIMAIGDSDNDYDMIAWAGLGVAMGNGNDRVKSAADYISSSNDEDGVARALKECLGI
ncbi:MAG: Cof-type HAD-IIB family hydrolase [Blautia sp.]